MNRKVCCDICGAELGMISLATLAVPLKAEMFESISPGQLPPPFLPGQGWLDFRCWQCHNRPQLYSEQVTFINDNYSKKIVDVKELMQKRSTGFTCECGNLYQHASSLKRHKEKCTWN